MGSKQTTTQEASKDPWKPAIPAVTNVLDRSQQIAADPNNFMPVQGDISRNSINALGALGASPSFGAGILQNAVGQTQQGLGSSINGLMQTANGGYLQGNPYLDAVLGKSMQDTADKVNSQFSAAGRYGSGAQTGELTRQLGGLEMNARMGNYDTERQNQMQAQGLLGQYGMSGAQMAPQVDAAKAAQIGYGLQAGSLQDAQAQAVKNAQSGLTGNQYQASLAVPIAGLGGTLSGTATQSQQPSMGAMIGGGLMSGLGLMMSPQSSFMGTAQNPSMFGKMFG
jgi:hypothetical protein